jgi:transcriptional regulator with XRE-family HTH domain
MKRKDENGPDLSKVVIPKNLGRLRRARGWTQEDFAAAARAVGLEWTRTRVTALEAGREVLSLGEGLLIQGVLGAKLAELVDPRSALAGESIQIEGLDVPRETLLDLARGMPRNLAPISIGLSDPRFRQLAKLAKAYGVPPHIRLLVVSFGEAEQKAARRLRDMGLKTKPLEISVASAKLWGHGLTQERDQRVRSRGVADPTRGLRGHVTRDLLEELAECVREKRRSSRRLTTK